jgi:uncharacterized protein YjbJ (UPF0337 family)
VGATVRVRTYIAPASEQDHAFAGRSRAQVRKTIPQGAILNVTNPNVPEETTGGPLGKLAGKVKAAAGSLTGNETLAREGRLQEAQVDAEVDARREAAEAEQAEQEAQLEQKRNETEEERKRLQAELAESDREARIERDREEAERKAERDKAEAAAKAEQERQREQQSVATLEKSADAVKAAAETEAEKLEREAKLAEARANAIDPEETR